jgi:hypothetical protein
MVNEAGAILQRANVYAVVFDIDSHSVCTDKCEAQQNCRKRTNKGKQLLTGCSS